MNDLKSDSLQPASPESRPGLMAFLPRRQRVWVPVLLFFMGLWLTAMVGLLIGSQTRNGLLCITVLQSLLAFIAPAVITGWVFTRKPGEWLAIKSKPAVAAMAGVLLMFIVAIPMLNWIVALNEALQLPSWASGLEQVMRRMEDNAQAATDTLLATTSVGGLLSALGVVGILGPFAEELFFRGALQRTLAGSHPWKAVWWTALIFSLIHFQMYGFVPRLLLGLWFGYLYLWTGSLWPAIFAHMLNNSATVVSRWLVARGDIDVSLMEMGADGSFLPVVISVLLSALIVTIFIRCRHGHKC